jgi:hypothetical protein
MATTSASSRDHSRSTSAAVNVLARLALTGTAVPTMEVWEQTMPAEVARRWQAPASHAAIPVQTRIVWGTRAAEVCGVATEHHLDLAVMSTRRPRAFCTFSPRAQGFIHRENGSLALRAHRSMPSGRVPPGAACPHRCGPGVAAARVLLCSLSRDTGRRYAEGYTVVDAPQAGLTHPQAARAGA